MNEEIEEKSDLVLGSKIFFYSQLIILVCYFLLMFGGEWVLKNTFFGFLSVFGGALLTVYLLPFLCLGGLVVSIWTFAKKVDIKWGLMSFVVSITSLIVLSYLYFAN